MITRTVVEFDRDERQILKVASRSLRITFPDIDAERPKHAEDRSLGQRARVIGAMAQRHGRQQWTYEQVADAAAALTLQVQTLGRESRLDYWLDQHVADGDAPVEPSTVPTSPYMQYTMLASVRDQQLGETRRALEVMLAAVQATAPADENEDAHAV